MSREIFALDIGTRKVMGIVASDAGGELRAADVETIEHSSRPMLDGQVHSIDEVVAGVKRIKQALESRLNKELNFAGVAVAGRNLQTHKMRVSRTLDSLDEISSGAVRSLELEAVSGIISSGRTDLRNFYCVGYSPVYYELDGLRIQDLAGHRGRCIACEVIATFLPSVVLDSIFSVLKKSGLEAANITLEPIAAINAIVPEEMRRLNIVLVDVGAGTSDLAISKDGVVFAYGMVPEAGDEITECICGNYLVDFETGEKIKRAVSSSPEISFKDIWDRPHTVSSGEVMELIRPSVGKLASSIAVSALELNGCVPQAVIAVGGGALTPGLLEALAEKFGLPGHKVGIRLPGAIKGLADPTGKLTGPEAVTPVGIAQMTASGRGLAFVNVTVNGKKVTLPDLAQKKDILGALSTAGCLYDKKLYPRAGLALTCEVDGEFKTVKGTVGEPAVITLNGELVDSLSSPVKDGDVIELTEARDGADAKAVVGDILNPAAVKVIFNNGIMDAAAPVFCNGVEAGLSDDLPDRAKLSTGPLTARRVLRMAGVDTCKLSERHILVNVNGTPRVLSQRNYTLKVNTRQVEPECAICPGDVIEFSSDLPMFYRVRDVIDIPEGPDSITVNINGSDVVMGISKAQVFMNGREVKSDEFLIDGADITVYHSRRQQVLLSEVFKYFEVDPAKVFGKRMRFFVDDAPAGFTTRVPDGARVKILFEDRNQSGGMK